MCGTLHDGTKSGADMVGCSEYFVQCDGIYSLPAASGCCYSYVVVQGTPAAMFTVLAFRKDSDRHG